MTTASHRNIHFVSLGCPKNQVDTEVMLGQVGAEGHRVVENPEDADVIVVNTCGFIDSAKEESIETILEMARHKENGTCEALVVTGCLTQRYPEEVAKEIAEIDHILGSGNYGGIAKVLGEVSRRSLPVVEVPKTPDYIYDHNTPRIVTGNRHSVYLKIAEGCDRPCAFCIIPKLRGPQRSRSIDSIVAEAAKLVQAGAVEINLVAQDLTRYGYDLQGRPSLAMLLEQLAQVDGLRWIRMHYTYPSAFDDKLIEVVAAHDNICNYIDVPLQHIDDELLKKMRRGHSSRVIRTLIERLRAGIPNVVLRTTFIVGHPGETEDAFAKLHDFVAETRFDNVGVFTYSREEGTVSGILPHRVDPEVAEERRSTIMETQRTISRQRNQEYIGEELEVLVDGISDESELLMQGRHFGQAPGIDGTVYLGSCEVAPGSLVRAHVTDAATTIWRQK